MYPAEFWVSPRMQPLLLCRCSHSFIISRSIYCTCSGESISVLSWGACDCPHLSRCGLTSSEWGGRITKPSLQSSCHLQIEPKSCLLPLPRGHVCFMVNLVSSRTLTAFLQSCFPCVWPQPLLKVDSKCHPEAATAGSVAESRHQQNNFHCNRKKTPKQINNVIVLKPQWIF